MTTITAIEKVKSILNTNCVDPFPGTRVGTQFYSEMDGTPNLNRANTFPKGYIFETDDFEIIKGSLHTSGWAMYKQDFAIHYFVKDKISYTPVSTALTDFRYLMYMKSQIIDTILDNVSLGDQYFIDKVGTPSRGRKLNSPNSQFTLYEVIIPITVKWNKKYG